MVFPVDPENVRTTLKNGGSRGITGSNAGGEEADEVKARVCFGLHGEDWRASEEPGSWENRKRQQ